MLERTNHGDLSNKAFQENFSQLTPLILEEWGQLDRSSLESTHGNFEQVIEQIATETEHTRTLIRRQLNELYRIVLQDQTQSDRSESGRSPQSNSSAHSSAASDIDQVLKQLEERTDELVAQFKKEVLPQLSDRARNNIGTSLLAALGMGFILGLLFGGTRGR
jgi:ElaB/YqjD/DUF883 family membrane-anchored ribosome-binding protein